MVIPGLFSGDVMLVTLLQAATLIIQQAIKTLLKTSSIKPQHLPVPQSINLPTRKIIKLLSSRATNFPQHLINEVCDGVAEAFIIILIYKKITPRWVAIIILNENKI